MTSACSHCDRAIAPGVPGALVLISGHGPPPAKFELCGDCAAALEAWLDRRSKSLPSESKSD
jgi:hypothetical protein